MAALGHPSRVSAHSPTQQLVWGHSYERWAPETPPKCNLVEDLVVAVAVTRHTEALADDEWLLTAQCATIWSAVASESVPTPG